MQQNVSNGDRFYELIPKLNLSLILGSSETIGITQT